MNKLIVACYCVNFENYDALDSILQPLQEYGVGVELSIFDDPGYIARLRAARERYLPYYVTFHAPHLEVEATSPEGSKERARIVRALSESFAISKEFDAHSIVMHTNQVSFRPEEKPLLQNRSVSTLLEIGHLAAEQGVNLLIENVGEAIFDSLLFDEDEFIHLFDMLHPSSGCLIDIGHAMINDWDFEKVIRGLRHKIRSYHLHNNDGHADIHRPLFENGMKYDRLRLRELLAWADRYTPEADWVLEYAPGPHITPTLVEDEVRQLLALVTH